jgi:hypothetical protein
MGICWSNCERKRYDKQIAEYRKEFPELSFNYNGWKNTSIESKLSNCLELKKDIEVLRILKTGKNADYLDGGGRGNQRVDARGQKAYAEILVQYEKINKSKYCGTVISLNTKKIDRERFLAETTDVANRVEDNTDVNRTILLSVGGFVLLGGAVIAILNSRK